MKKLLIAIPSMDMVSARFAQSLATIQKPCEAAVAFQIGSLIYDARNKLVQQAVKFEADYMLWLDSDMVFPPDTLMTLYKDILEGRDIVTGLYFRRVMPFKPVIFKKLERGERAVDYEDYPKDEIFEVAGCGFGCVLMKMDVAFDIAATSGDWFSPLPGFGEDISFCIRAREAGYKIYCDPRIKLGHVGFAIVDHTAYEATKGEKV